MRSIELSNYNLMDWTLFHKRKSWIDLKIATIFYCKRLDKRTGGLSKQAKGICNQPTLLSKFYRPFHGRERRTSVSIGAGFRSVEHMEIAKKRLKLSACNKSTACHPISGGPPFIRLRSALSQSPTQTHAHIYTRSLSKFGQCCSSVPQAHATR